MSPILSILVITHNQLSLLKRCLDSVLQQKLNIPFEVVVSDDRSDDGTEEYMTALCASVDKLGVVNLVQIIYTRCNSNDCDPANVSERCGWNKLNVYNHSSGQYFVNIDADDYLRSDDIYQLQYDTLIAHPECSMCMQSFVQISNGDDLANGIRWPSLGLLNNDQIICEKDIITTFRTLNQCYMIRKHPNDDMLNLYGKFFDDTIITQHHLRYGPCVYVDRADYVWVQYKTSITNSLSEDDSLVEYGLLQLHHMKMIPLFKNEFMEAGLHDFLKLLKEIQNKKFRLNLTERTLVGMRRENGYIFKTLSKSNINFFDKIKLIYIRYVLLLFNKFKLNNWDYILKILL